MRTFHGCAAFIAVLGTAVAAPVDGEGGGARPGHWAFQAPVRPELPAVQNEAWVRNPLDRFVLARVEQKGLAPSPEADRAALLRRLSLDLTGLPPSLTELESFLSDTAPGAFERQVERLLQSPHYGERWARHWLDAARYADSDGYEKDKLRTVWFYRDWVINALNRDLPYDQFIIEQIAGDQLPGAGQDQIVATGFLRNSMINEEGGVDPEQFRMEAMFDRMDAIGKSVLGLTIQCAQCHDHKFDPITQLEYFQLFAFINNSHEASTAVYTPEQQMRRERLFREIREIEAGLKEATPDWTERMEAWEAQLPAEPEWHVVEPSIPENSTGGQKYIPLNDGSFLAQGYAPTKHRVKLMVDLPFTNITAFRLELLNDPNLPLHGPGRSLEGTAALTEFEIEAAPLSDRSKNAKVKLAQARADLNPAEAPLKKYYDDRSGRRRVTGPVQYAIDGNDDTAWSSDAGPGRRNRPATALFIPEAAIQSDSGVQLSVYLRQNHGGWNSDDNQSHNLGRFRLAVATANPGDFSPVPSSVREMLAVSREVRTPAHRSSLFGYWRNTVPEWQVANARIENLWGQHPEPVSQLVLQDRDNPRATHLLNRGDFLQPAEVVRPGVPAFLHALPEGAPETRLSFARWLVDKRSPTTARALVNRVWQTYFGIGLVSTSEDLGTQTEAPSHPELLDWLAVEFMDSGWSLKQLHRWITTSATYRQSSKVSPDLYSQDPYNRLLARGARFRVEAEIVRDIALAASGLLHPKVGGPSVFPPLPRFMLEPPVSYGPKVWHEESGPERYRRALYTFRYRSLPYPVLQAFDAPNGDYSCVRRVRSNTPLQALASLNEPIFMDCARALALDTLREGGGSDDERIAYAFRRCVSRKPVPEELAELRGLLARQTRHIQQGWVNAWELAAGQARPELPHETTPAQLAAWTTLARVLLNLDETITRE